MPTMSGLCLAFFTTPNDKQILESDFMGLTFYVKVPEDDDPGVWLTLYRMLIGKGKFLIASYLMALRRKKEEWKLVILEINIFFSFFMRYMLNSVLIRAEEL